MLEHPVITRLRATGHHEPRAVCRCCDCGGGLRSGDGYYGVAGEIFCESCMQLRREEVE